MGFWMRKDLTKLSGLFYRNGRDMVLRAKSRWYSKHLLKVLAMFGEYSGHYFITPCAQAERASTGECRKGGGRLARPLKATGATEGQEPGLVPAWPRAEPLPPGVSVFPTQEHNHKSNSQQADGNKALHTPGWLMLRNQACVSPPFLIMVQLTGGFHAVG